MSKRRDGDKRRKAARRRELAAAFAEALRLTAGVAAPTGKRGKKLARWLARAGASGAALPAPAALGLPVRGATSRAADAAGVATVPKLAGGRVTLDDPLARSGWGRVVLPPADADSHWRALALDDRTLDRLPPSRLLTLLVDLSPDFSRGLWDYLRCCNPGHTIRALIPGTTDPFEQAQAQLDEFTARLVARHGSLDVPFGRLFIGTYLRGAMFAELGLDAAGRVPLDLFTPDPHTARFSRVDDPVYGQTWQLGQLQGAAFVPLDRPTVRYLPLDPLPGSPYGRALANPALFPTLFLLGLLHDLRRVVAQQGWPRLDITVDIQAIVAAMPPQDRSNPREIKRWVEDTITETQEIYRRLQPDEAYIHTNTVTLNRPQGTVDSSSLGAVDGLIKAIERMSARALKTMPLLMGTTDGVSEANANRQWEIYAAGIKAIQHYAETLLGELFGLALRAQGLAADVEVRFAELRAAELLRDSQTQWWQIRNALAQYLAGWISHEAAAQRGAGVDKPDAAGPRDAAAAQSALTSGGGGGAGGNPEPGSNRGLWLPFPPTRLADGSQSAGSDGGAGAAAVAALRGLLADDDEAVAA